MTTKVLEPRAAGARRFENKICVVAGAGQGIGSATVRRLAQEGATVVIGDWVEDTARKVCQEVQDFGGKASVHVGNYSQADDAKGLIDFALKSHGRIDSLVVIVGGTIFNQPYDRDFGHWEFEPGDRVVCEPVDTSEGRVLAAVRSASQSEAQAVSRGLTPLGAGAPAVRVTRHPCEGCCTGTAVSEAALIDPQRWNRYAYGLNNPFVYVDPDGAAIELLGGAEDRDKELELLRRSIGQLGGRLYINQIDDKGKTISRQFGELKVVRPMPVGCDGKASGVVVIATFQTLVQPRGTMLVKLDANTTVTFEEQAD